MNALYKQNVRAIFNALGRYQGVKDLYTGDCKGCGECCARFIPLSRFDVQRIAEYVLSHDVSVSPETRGIIDLTCPFLNDKKECSIYTARPEICRTYRCDEHKAGKIKIPAFAHAMKIKDMRELWEFICESKVVEK